MSKMKMMMIVNSSNDNLCEYLPNDSPQYLMNELKDLTNSLKNIPSQGSTETLKNKFVYRQYSPNKNFSKEEDQLVIFICCDLSFKDNIITKFFDEIQENFSNNSYKGFKLDPDTKKIIAKTFYKYHDSNNINKEITDWKKYNLEFATLREYTSLDIDTKKTSQSLSIYGIIDSMDEKDISKINKGTNGAIRLPIEVSKIKKWKTLKCFLLIINIILIALAICFIFYIIGQRENE